MRVLPGDVALVIMGGDESDAAVSEETLNALRKQLGLLDSLPVQYGKWAWSMVNGEFGGVSLVDKQPLSEIIAQRLPRTLQLTFLTFLIAIPAGIPLGIIAALYQNRWPDYLARMLTIGGLALPNFWLALLMLLALILWFQWTPPIFYVDFWEDPWTHLQIVIWPAIILAWGFSAYVARITRSNMLEVLRQDYVRTAYSKGLATRTVLWRHALRNALIPVVTLTGTYLGTLLGGTVILESIFSIPGMGQGILRAAWVRDYPVVQSLAMLLVVMALVLNLLTDIIYVFIDPRIKY